jgi:uncharacterized membrane protein YjjP (DUF1212 family)
MFEEISKENDRKKQLHKVSVDVRLSILIKKTTIKIQVAKQYLEHLFSMIYVRYTLLNEYGVSLLRSSL